jgi:hypothetical protein
MADKEDEREAFRRHLREAREVVSTWPVWKQTLLGGRPVSNPPQPARQDDPRKPR